MKAYSDPQSTQPFSPVTNVTAGIAAAREAGGVVEGFALETGEGLIFTVKGLIHPPDGTVAYLRYLPDERGERRRDGVPYRKVYAFDDMVAALKAHGGAGFLVDDPVLGARLQIVPDGHVIRVYDPRRRLVELRRAPADALEDAAARLADAVGAAAGVPAGDLGISGSLLFGLQAPDSDLDAVVYGDASCRIVHETLRSLLADPRSGLRPHDAAGLAAVAAAHRPDTPISPSDFVRLQGRKVNEFTFDGRGVFFRFVKRPGEGGERYGERRYQPLGQAVIRARVHDAREALFTPCSYGVGDVTVVEGAPADRLGSVVSYRGRFADQAREGEWITARGTVERVVPAAGAPSTRLVVGAPGDFLISAPG